MIDASLKTNLKMKKLSMRRNERIQDFINRFETLLTNLIWNDFVICFNFRRKLTSEILTKIHNSHFNAWFSNFVAFKIVAQQIESHIKMRKRILKNRKDEDNREFKRVRFMKEERDRISSLYRENRDRTSSLYRENRDRTSSLYRENRDLRNRSRSDTSVQERRSKREQEKYLECD